MQPLAQFKVSEGGRNGTLTVFPDRIERTTRGMVRKNTGVEITPFSRVSSVQMKRHIRRNDVIIFASGNNIEVTVYGDADGLVRLLNAGMAGQLTQQQQAPQAAPSGPPAGWYADPSGGAGQRWWDGYQWTAHQQGG